MEFANSSVPGVIPDYGAIFISNSETRIESFKRKIFGLPYSFASFVKQVKSGMILFLYDSDTRHLYGVFRAVSDGTMGIAQHAYSSSGKRFPAQVKITTMWECAPLSESEFRECIKDNYFSAHKFKFGLSEYQVQSLLHLFCQRKIKLPMSPRQPTRTGRSEQPRTTLSNVGVPVEQHRVVSNDNFENLNYNDVGLYSGPFAGKYQQQTDGGTLMGTDLHHVENGINHSMLRENHMNALVNEKILRDDNRISPSYTFENKGYTGNDYDPILSRGNSRNNYGEVNRPAADHSFMRSTRSILNPINSWEHTSNSLNDGSNAVANQQSVTNTNQGLDSINSRHFPRSLFGEGIDAVANHSLARNVFNDFDSISSRDLPQNLFRDRSSDTLDRGLIGKDLMENTCDLGNEDYNGNYSSINRVGRVVSLVPCYDNLDHRSNMVRNSAYSLGTLKKIAEDERLIYNREDEYNPDNSQFVQLSSQSLSSFKGDPMRSSADGYNPDLPMIHLDLSSSFLAERNSDDLNINLHANINNMPNMYSLSQNQPFQHQMQQPAYLNSLPEVKTCSRTNWVSDVSPPTVGYPDTTRVCSADYEASNGLHTSEFSLSAPAFRKMERQLNHEGPYSTIPDEDASFFNENQQLAVLNEERQNKMPWRENNVFDECSPNSSHLLGSTKQNRKEDCHYDHNTKPHRELKGVDCDIPKKRNSVFERLTVADKVKQRAKNMNNRSDDGVDASVKEIMGMLRRDHSHWIKVGKSTSPIEASTNTKSLSFPIKKESCKSKMMNIDRASENEDIPASNLAPNLFPNKKESSKSKMMNIDHASNHEDPASNLASNIFPVYQDSPIANFKRRSQLREQVKQNLSSDPVDDSLPKIQQKKRKLIRPDFGKAESSQVTDVNINRDTTNLATLEANPATDASPQNQAMKRKLGCRDMVKTDSPLGKDDNINDRDKTNPEAPEPNPATDASPQKYPMKRKLLRQDMVETGTPHAKDDCINNSDKTNPATPEPNPATNASPQNQPIKKRFVWRNLVKTDSPLGKDGNNNKDKNNPATPEPNPTTDASPQNQPIKRKMAWRELVKTGSPPRKDDNVNDRDKTNPATPEPNPATDASPQNQHIKRKMAWRELVKTDSSSGKDDNVNDRDKTNPATPEPNSATDASPQNQPIKRKMAWRELVKTGSPPGKDDNVNDRDKTNLATPEPNPSADASPPKQPMKRKLVRQETGSPHAKDDKNRDKTNPAAPEPNPKTDSPHVRDDNNDNNNSNEIASVSSEHRMDSETKNCEEIVKKEDNYENVDSGCETISK